MQVNEEIMYRVFEKCEIQIEGQTISKELLLKTFGDFLTQTIAKRDHNIGVVMHTGSICFDVVLITYATILNLISNKAETMDIISSFSEGDTVLYGQPKKCRYIFKGFIEGSEIGTEKGKKFIKLVQSEISTKYVSEKEWRNIEPYNGDSVRMDGRGIKKKTSLRDDFYVDVLDFKKENIPSILDTSCVIVAPREHTDYLVKNISLGFNKKKINLLELVTASYFTEEDEYRYSGNTGKNEPTLKFTAKISVARHLLLSRRGNRHLGLIVLGEDSISRGYSELPELINRKSLQYVYICSSMDSDLGLELTSDVEKMEIFACTKEFLLENTTYEKVENNHYITELVTQVDTIIDKNNELVIIEKKGIESDVIHEFKKNILEIKREEYSTEGKDNFIMLAHSLMKLFVTAPFPMDRFSVAEERGLIEVDSPEKKILELRRLAEDFPENLRKNTLVVVEVLERILIEEKSTNGKYEWLRKFLYDHLGKRVAIVVPKAYYVTLIKGTGLFSEYLFRNKDFVTANRFDSSKMYDCVIVLGDYEGKAFNVFRCNAAATIISVIYESEKTGYYFKNKIFHNRINRLNRKSTITISNQDEDEIITTEDENENGFEKEMEGYIANVDLSYMGSIYKSDSGYEGAMNTDIVAVVVFDDDTKAYLSRNYKGYVLEETTGIVKEIGVQELCEGDSIIFTKNNDDTKDIVSSILAKLFIDGRFDSNTEEKYRKSNLWKRSLVEFMRSNGYTARKVVDLMLKDGSGVHEQTILHWLDEDSYTVGPRDVDSIRHIGNITGVEELKENPEDIFEACRDIRSIRRKILDQVGEAIFDKLSGRTPQRGNYMESIYEKIDTLAEIKRVERIAKVETAVPMWMANRPILI
jgi:hypothetical protein